MLSSPFWEEGGCFFLFLTPLYWPGKVDASSSSAWHLDADLEPNGLQNSMAKIVTATTQGERSRLHSLYCTVT